MGCGRYLKMGDLVKMGENFLSREVFYLRGFSRGGRAISLSRGGCGRPAFAKAMAGKVFGVGRFALAGCFGVFFFFELGAIFSLKNV